MATTTVERIIEEVNTLTPEERQQVVAFFGSATSPQPQATTLEREREFAHHLLAKGIISNIPARLQEGYRPEDEPERHPPIIVHGEPVSETVIRERR